MDVKRLDFPDRELLILADGDWRGFRSNACAKEPETVEWLRRVAPGSVVWDVGASVGPYSLVAAALGAESVIAFEPFAPSYGHLVQNAWLNKSHLTALPIALGTRRGLWSFQASDIYPGSGSHGDGRFLQIAMWKTADDMLEIVAPSPDHIKIDVDGGEVGVIEGGRTVWSQAQSILIEASAKTIEDIAVILGACGLEQTGKWERSGGMFNYLYERSA